MNALSILIAAALLLAALAICVWALSKATTTRYYCVCPHIQPPCSIRVAGPGGLCPYCLQGDHRGHV